METYLEADLEIDLGFLDVDFDLSIFHRDPPSPRVTNTHIGPVLGTMKNEFLGKNSLEGISWSSWVASSCLIRYIVVTLVFLETLPRAYLRVSISLLKDGI